MEDKILFEKTFQRKLIYVFRINDEAHKGLLKIGDATIKSDLPNEKLTPSCSELNKAAKQRINSYTNTAGIDYELLYTELAIRTEKDKNNNVIIQSFRDKNVHELLENSGIKKVKVNNTTGQEWYKIDLETAKNAIKAVKNNQISLTPGQISTNKNPIIFRPEQKDAITKTIKTLKTSDRMLWNAKMRFGKTICALEVTKQLGFQKTLIISHRPVVDSGWHDDFNKIFKDEDKTEYIAKGIKFDIEEKIKKNEKFIYFMSIQDLRGSQIVGGNFDKNDKIFETMWDFIIIDEAHEGTTTSLGNDVKELLRTDNHTKILELSGTPFNIMDKYEQNNVYTWDYMMEQSSKQKWDIEHFGDSNPYEELPQMKIYTYDLGESLGVSEYEEIEDKAFNFKEFFRTWTLDDNKKPADAIIGGFVHKVDIENFLNLITNKNDCNNYPYSCEEYRNFFKHSLWMLPGVKEAKALSTMLKSHPVFGSGQFEIVNIAGDGDEEDDSQEALTKVKTAIKKALENDTYTITLSCGKLTTGVTIPEWTAVMMLSGSYSTSAANYLQTIFRVQSPANINGMRKEYCYVFDFAPDRTLKMIADAVQLSTKAGKANNADRKLMGEFLNFCPVISYSGTRMVKYDESKLLQQLKRAYAERALKSGFDDTNLYNDELLKLNEVELQQFDNLKKIIGSTKASPKTKDIDINKQGLTNEEHEQLEKLNKKPKKDRTPEEEARLEELKAQKEQRQKAISILRAISIRIPLLIYGADISKEIVTIEDLLKDDVIDINSWEEFMPKGVDKELFKTFIKYYDIDVFNAASQKIRKIVKYADTLSPTERAMEISKLFSYFKNPDKETVLTPWRVVNMHLGDCLGGYNFFDEKFEKDIDEPRFVNQGEVTNETLGNTQAQILEINSKTGLYPLYVTYSIFRSKCPDIKNTPVEEQRKIWNETVQNNIYVICKTPMAKSITKRTLVGFNDVKINAHYFEDLINTIQHKPKQFVERIKKPNYWNKKDKAEMRFDAVVGNPPYQMEDNGNGNSAKPLYHLFIDVAEQIEPRYVSMISPSRWFAGGKGLDEFRQKMLNDRRLQKMFDYTNAKDCFPNISISGGVSYILWNNNYDGDCEFTSIHDGVKNCSKRNLSEFSIFIRYNQALSVIEKVKKYSENSLIDSLTSRNPFGISTFERGNENKVARDIVLYSSNGKGFIDRSKVTANKDLINQYKVMISRLSAEHAGEANTKGQFKVLSTTQLLKPNEVCTDSYIILKDLNSETLANNAINYLKTKFARFLLLQALSSINLSKERFCFVPMQNFNEDWSDKKLYKKYGLSEEEISYIESMIRSME